MERAKQIHFEYLEYISTVCNILETKKYSSSVPSTTVFDITSENTSKQFSFNTTSIPESTHTSSWIQASASRQNYETSFRPSNGDLTSLQTPEAAGLDQSKFLFSASIFELIIVI